MASRHNVFASHIIYGRYDVQYPILIGSCREYLFTRNIVEMLSLEKMFHTFPRETMKSQAMTLYFLNLRSIVGCNMCKHSAIRAGVMHTWITKRKC